VLFSREPRLRPLSERECYLRLHGERSGEVEIVARRERPVHEIEPLLLDEVWSPEPWLASGVERVEARVPVQPHRAGPTGPTDERPAVHLVFSYPRGASRISGEEIRRELLARMQRRHGEAA
jgi:hypothetical protein